jgi:WD40 repeat protein
MIELWDMAAGTVANTLAGHTDRVTGLAFSPDGKFLGSVSYYGTFELWDAAEGTAVRAFNAGMYTDETANHSRLIFTADGNLLALWFALDSSTVQIMRVELPSPD